MSLIRHYQPSDAAIITALWNRFWAGVPRAFPIGSEDFVRRVTGVLGWEETQLLLTDGGFVHFGPREPWWFRWEDRPPRDRETGMIYALCATDDEPRAALLAEAEARLRVDGARHLRLWPTWAQGTVPFYSGLSPSNEICGLWGPSPLAAWAELQGYRIDEHYRLGVLSTLDQVPAPSLPEDTETLWKDFATPLLPGAKRLIIQHHGEEVATVIAVESTERRRVTGEREWAAFDVSVAEAHRGRGWGKALMRALAAQVVREGGTTLQLHMVQENLPAEALYFRSLGFVPMEDSFLSLEKV